MEEAILSILKQAEGFVSGSELGKRLGVSRAAIWKGIARLREEGYTIEAQTNKGYRFLSAPLLYTRAGLAAAIEGCALGHPLHFYTETDSTNHRIRDLGMEGAPEGALVVALHQTGGKGRLGRAWASDEHGVWMSLLLRPEISPAYAPVLTLLTGLAVCRAIRKLTGLPAMIKWPNDILIEGKKVCGILTELSAEMEKVHFVIVGIGINVTTPSFLPELAQKATSLLLSGAQEVSRTALVAEILHQMAELYTEYCKNPAQPVFFAEYSALCDTLGKEVHVVAKEPFDATAVRLSPQGELVVRLPDGRETVVFSGEVSIRKKEDTK